MRTKHIPLLALAALLTVFTASCNKENASPAPVAPQEQDEPVTIQLSVVPDAPMTRATTEDTEEEARVSAVEFLVFKQDGDSGSWIIDGFKRITGTTTTSMTLTQGARRICAIVNPTRTCKNISTYNDLLYFPTMLKDQTMGNLTMYGSTNLTVTANTSTISIPVNRMLARLKIHKITNALSNSVLASDNFAITRIFLSNVPAEAYPEDKSGFYTEYALTGIGDALSKSSGTLDATTEKPRVNAFIYKAFDTPVYINAGASYSTAHCFYSFPKFDQGDYLSLIVEAKINSRFYTYPIRLEFPIQRNVSYEITELVITRPGNPSDGDDTLTEDETRPIEFVTVDNINVSVKDWTLFLLGNDGTVEF